MSEQKVKKEIPVSKRRGLPVSKIKALVRLAIDNNLALLKVGDIQILPNAKPMAPKLPGGVDYKHEGRELTPREMENLTLFGPDGIKE